ncbi:MAG: hypothetical protein ACWGPN_04720 [Gammaproteobacteria bacterium]
MNDWGESDIAEGLGLPNPSSVYEILRGGDELDFRGRSNLVELERQLYAKWGLGRNLILAWAAHEQGVLLLVVPHYAVAAYTVSTHGNAPDQSEDHDFVVRLMSGPRRYSTNQIYRAARLLGTEPFYARLRQPLGLSAAEVELVERMIERYAVSFVRSRAVALFDIVGFGLLSPFEQMTQLNSLSYSLNSAHSKMLNQNIAADFARSSTGDGFYLWNRKHGVTADTNLYHYMHLVLADNAVAHSRAKSGTVPRLRVCFHVGSCYEFPRAEGLNPSMTHDIVGNVTVELARMIDGALPGQIFVGDFTSMRRRSPDRPPAGSDLDSVHFVDLAQARLSCLNGLELSGEAIESIKCYLTGKPCADGTFTIRKLTISDKHGLSRNVFNAKVNIYRRSAEPIYLGVEDKELAKGALPVQAVEHIFPDRLAGPSVADDAAEIGLAG